jgi:hypothetical protein
MQTHLLNVRQSSMEPLLLSACEATYQHLPFPFFFLQHLLVTLVCLRYDTFES